MMKSKEEQAKQEIAKGIHQEYPEDIAEHFYVQGYTACAKDTEREAIEFAEWMHRNILNKYLITDLKILSKRGDAIYWYCKEQIWIENAGELYAEFRKLTTADKGEK